MDLLQYESSSDDDDGDETRQQLTSTTAAATGTAAAVTRPGTGPTVTAATAAPASTVMLSKRGKKVLSLQAVLPQHILEQLTKSQVRAGLARRLQDGKKNKNGNTNDSGDDSDSDSDSSSSDYANAPSKEALPNSSDPIKKKSAATAATTATVKADAGISSFLSELQAAPIAGPPITRLSSSKPSAAVTAENFAIKKPQPMGAAFLSAAVTTTTATTTVVRDIHGEESTTAATPSSSDMKLNETTIAKDTRKPPPPPPPAHQPQGMGLRRPVVVMAAPRVRAAPAISSSTRMMQSQQQQQDPAAADDWSDEPPVAFETAEALQKSSKRSRKEMERLLRHGQLDDAVRMNDSGNMTCMQQAAPDQYAAPGEEQVIDSSSMQQHGVRVVPTPMYDPATGQTVKGIGGGSKNKNQISHLLQSAASLELSRAQAAAGSSSSSTQIGKTNRANAKRKYGW